MTEGYRPLARRSLSFVVCLGVVMVAASACHRQTAKVQTAKLDENSYRQQIEKWHTERAANLTKEDGWLTLVGLFWLKEGENRLGSDASNDIVLPQGKAPAHAASLWLDKGTVKLVPQPRSGIMQDGKTVDSPLALQPDTDAKPTVLNLATLSFYVIKRGEQLGLRVKDKENPARTQFAGLNYFPVESKWRIESRFEPYNPAKMIPIVNVLGMVEEQPSPGKLVFDVDGKSYSLDAIAEEGSKELFIIFKDETSGKETYGAGRYLDAEPADAQGNVILDFNKAYNPPCAFTTYATCPLPPAQNRLALRVEAGEMKYSKSSH